MVAHRTASYTTEKQTIEDREENKTARQRRDTINPLAPHDSPFRGDFPALFFPRGTQSVRNFKNFPFANTPSQTNQPNRARPPLTKGIWSHRKKCLETR